MLLFRVRLYEIHTQYFILTNIVLLPNSQIRKEIVMYSRSFVLVTFLIILSPFQIYAGTVTQTDWSGGDGIFGPVIDWGNEFYVATDIECYNNPFNIFLQNTILEHTVDEDFDNTRSVYSADINGDGYMDILGAAYTDDDITWWDLNSFILNGSLESSVLDAQESPAWQTIDWTCTEPVGTGVAFQVRASDNSSSMGEWSDTLLAPCSLIGILTDEDSYLHYRVILNTTDSSLTPVLNDVTVNWLPYTSIEEGSAGEVSTYSLYGARPNPVLGHAALVFTLPVDAGAELTVYDLTGRVVYSINGEYKTGVHEVILDDLASGVYVVRMTSGEFVATCQFVVID